MKVNPGVKLPAAELVLRGTPLKQNPKSRSCLNTVQNSALVRPVKEPITLTMAAGHSGVSVQQAHLSGAKPSRRFTLLVPPVS